MHLGEISLALGMSKTAVMKWLVKMENEGAVKRTFRHNLTGRPSYIFSLSDNGKSLNEPNHKIRFLLI